MSDGEKKPDSARISLNLTPDGRDSRTQDLLAVPGEGVYPGGRRGSQVRVSSTRGGIGRDWSGFLRRTLAGEVK